MDYRSEAGRIDLNAASKELLAGLFTTLGARPAAAEFYAERIVGWRTSVNPQGQDTETSTYRTAGRTLWSSPGPFPHTGELSLVLGLPEFFVERALPFVTVYSGQGQINIFDSAPEVIAALTRDDAARLHRVLAQRDAGRQNAPTQC